MRNKRKKSNHNNKSLISDIAPFGNRSKPHFKKLDSLLSKKENAQDVWKIYEKLEKISPDIMNLK